MNEPHCYYCSQIISADDDAQRIERRKYAHTACAFAADEAYWARLDEAEGYDANQYAG